MKPTDFFKELIGLYSEAGKSKFPNQNVFRGRNASVSSSLEDLFADFLAKNNPNKCTYYIDQPMKFGLEKFPKYPDIAIQNQDGVIEHLIDMKADLGWNRNGMLEFCSKWSKRIEDVKTHPTTFNNGNSKDPVTGKLVGTKRDGVFSENLHYHIVVATQYNSGNKVVDDYKEVNNKDNFEFKNVSLYILSGAKKHPNDQTISQEELLNKMDIRPDEFKRLLSAIVKVN